ncbi:MAG: hypothetical protein ACSLEY_01710 [Candidatus Saccharimonadales bacterium]
MDNNRPDYIRPVESAKEIDDILPDLSVGATEEAILRRSRWAGIIEVRYVADDLADDETLLEFIELHLQGRTPMTRMGRGLLLADFQVRDDSGLTKTMLDDFAQKLGGIMGMPVSFFEGRIVQFDTESVDHLLGDEYRPRPYLV